MKPEDFKSERYSFFMGWHEEKKNRRFIRKAINAIQALPPIEPIKMFPDSYLADDDYGVL